MNNSKLKKYGFTFDIDGREYSFVVEAESVEEAMIRVDAMKNAAFAGELHEVPNT